MFPRGAVILPEAYRANVIHADFTQCKVVTARALKLSPQTFRILRFWALAELYECREIALNWIAHIG